MAGVFASARRCLPESFKQIVGWTLSWYVGAVACITCSKVILSSTSESAVCTLTLSQFSITLVLCTLQAHLDPTAFATPRTKRQSLAVAGNAAMMTVGFLSTNAALFFMDADLVETIKATEPIPTIVVSTLLTEEGLPPFRVLAALAVVVSGVALASYAVASFSVPGLLSVMVANVSFATSNVLAKVFMEDGSNQLPAINFWLGTVRWCALLNVPGTLMENIQSGWAVAARATDLLPLYLVGGCSFYIYNQAMYAICEFIPMSTHAALNSVRRGLVVTWTTIFFRTSLSTVNLAGLAIVVVGFSRFLQEKSNAGAACAAACGTAAIASLEDPLLAA